MSRSRTLFQSLPTPITLFIVILVALLPFGAWLVYSAQLEVNREEASRRGAASASMLAGARAAEGLIARNTLALRVAANGALLSGDKDPCLAARGSIDIAPALARDFAISDSDGTLLCGEGRDDTADREPVRAGGVRMWLSPADDAIVVQVGVAGGTATSLITRPEIADAVRDVSPALVRFRLSDGEHSIDMLDPPDTPPEGDLQRSTIEVAGGRLQAMQTIAVARTDWNDRQLVLLPILMWLLAAALAWWLVERMLARPIRRLRRAVVDYDEHSEGFEIPAKLGLSSEVRDLAGAFSQTVDRIADSESQLVTALDGQRRLVREVHHRVKNNLQVVASLLNIHSRTAVGSEAQAAYAGIGRRVEALAVVHRNHFAEVEESRGIALRPLLTELATGLRASAPAGQSPVIRLELDTASTTQDTAVAAAFLVTEIVEYAMERDPAAEIEIQLRRTGELGAELAISSEALIKPQGEAAEDRKQFERVVDGLARQLRSSLDRKLSSYAVDLSIFPED